MVYPSVARFFRKCDPTKMWFRIACKFPHEMHQCHRYPYHCRFHPREPRPRPQPIPIPQHVPHEFLVYRAQKQSKEGLNLRRIYIYQDIQKVSREQKIKFFQMWFGKKSLGRLRGMIL